MKASYSWLKDYVDVTIDPKKLAYMLTMAGLNVTSCEKVGGEYIFEFEITANRADCLSIVGIAREIAALLGKKLKLPKELRRTRNATHNTKSPLINVVLEDRELCPRYTARIVKDVEVRPSPDWLKERILSVGLRPVNNIVDITNFVLFETGQPMHAFDLDRIKGNIHVRKARDKERIVTLDGATRTCEKGMLVIADDTSAIALAGIMGGLQTEVTDMTRNILLESAFFNPVSVRRTSRLLGIGSESSYRFERRIDRGMILPASNRACALIEEIARGKADLLIDRGARSAYSKIINLDFEKTNSLLGTDIAKNKGVKILKSLGFEVRKRRNSFRVKAPSFREDVKNETDLTEEIARIYGYDRIPLSIPQIKGNVKIKDLEESVREEISNLLVRFGLNEIITYSLIGRKNMEGLLNVKEDEVVTVKNPLSIDQEIMRPTLLAGMLGAVSFNLNRRAKGISFFEIGKVYRQKGGSYIEKAAFSVGLAGIKEENWKAKTQDYDFFDIKGILEKLLERLDVKGVVFRKAGIIEGLSRHVCASLESDGKIVGYAGEVDGSVLAKYDIEKRVFYAEVYIDTLTDKINLARRYTPISRYPAVIRDISIILDKSVSSQTVKDIIGETGRGLVKNVSLVDCYEGKQIPSGKMGLLYRIEYRSDTRTLEDKEVDKLHSEIKSALSKRLTLSFR